MDHTTPRKILAICSANRCRSVTLAALVNATPECEARSAGTHPIPGGTPITETDLRWADLIIVFEEVHVRTLKSRFPNVSSRLRSSTWIPDLYPPYNQASIDLLGDHPAAAGLLPRSLGYGARDMRSRRQQGSTEDAGDGARRAWSPARSQRTGSPLRDGRLRSDDPQFWKAATNARARRRKKSAGRSRHRQSLARDRIRTDGGMSEERSLGNRNGRIDRERRYRRENQPSGSACACLLKKLARR
jgi:predicted protein tyrosine phosphatase